MGLKLCRKQRGHDVCTRERGHDGVHLVNYGVPDLGDRQPMIVEWPNEKFCINDCGRWKQHASGRCRRCERAANGQTCPPTNNPTGKGGKA